MILLKIAQPAWCLFREDLEDTKCWRSTQNHSTFERTYQLSHRRTHLQIFLESILVQKPAKKSKQGIPQKLCSCVVFIGNCSQLSNHTTFFPTNRCRSILLKRWQWSRASQDNAIKRALKLEATKVSTVLDQMIPTNFVIVRCPRTGFFYFSIMWVFKSHVNVLLLFPQIRCWPIHGSRSLLCGCWKQVFVCTLVDTNIIVTPKTATLPQHDFCTRDE